MEPIQEPRTPKLKVVPPNKIQPPADSSAHLPLPSPPTNKISLSPNDGRKPSHTLIMVGTILAAVVGISLIPWDHKVSGSSSIEPHPSESKTVSLPQGHILEKLYDTTRQVQRGEKIATTIDPQYEEKLRKVRQDISETEGNQQLVDGEFQLVTSQLQRVEASRQTAITNLQQSRKNLERATSIVISQQEIETRQQEQEGLRNERRNKQLIRARYQIAIDADAANAADEKVVRIDGEIEQLTTKIKALDAPVIQAQAKTDLEGFQLRDKIDRDSAYLAEQNEAVRTANQEVSQVERKRLKIVSQIQYLLKEEKILKEEKNKQTILTAPFSGVADFKEAQQYLDQKLPRAIDIKIYNPQNMLVKAKVSQLDYQYIKDNQTVEFTPEGKREIMGKVKILDVQQDKEQDMHDPSKKLSTVWISLDDTQTMLEKDATGSVLITIKKQRIYNIVGGEIYKLVPFLRPLFHSFGGR